MYEQRFNNKHLLNVFECNCNNFINLLLSIIKYVLFAQTLHHHSAAVTTTKYRQLQTNPGIKKSCYQLMPQFSLWFLLPLLQHATAAVRCLNNAVIIQKLKIIFLLMTPSCTRIQTQVLFKFSSK